MPSIASKRLYFRGIPKDVAEDDLFKYLSRYGQICEVKLLSNYAFVQFESGKDALLVLETYKHQPLLGSRVVVEFAHPLRKDIASFSSNSSTQSRPAARRAIYERHPVVVLGLPRDTRWQELKDFGRSSGMLVAFCDLDSTQAGRGFIEFFTREDAQRAIRRLNGKHLGGRKVRVIDHEEMHDSQHDARKWDRSRSRSPRRRDAIDKYTRQVDDRLFDTLSARRAYSPIRRLPPAIDADYDYSKLQYSEIPFHSGQPPNLVYEEHTNWAYNLPEVSVGSFERISSEYYQYQDYMRSYYDEGYDPREGVHHLERLDDPYQ